MEKQKIELSKEDRALADKLFEDLERSAYDVVRDESSYAEASIKRGKMELTVSVFTDCTEYDISGAGEEGWLDFAMYVSQNVPPLSDLTREAEVDYWTNGDSTLDDAFRDWNDYYNYKFGH